MNFKLSIIIPTYQKFSYLKRTLNLLLENLKEAEIIVVDDGSKDETYKIKDIFKEKIKYLRNEKNQGKGESLRKGFNEANGEFLIFTDDDLPYGIDSINKIYEELQKGNEIVIGERKEFYNDIFYKKLMRPFLYLFIRLLFGLKYKDTQCGLKGFKKEVGKKLFAFSFVKGFSIDVEILYLAKKLNYKVKTIKLGQIEKAPSTFRLEGILKMFFDLIKIKFHCYKIKNMGKIKEYPKITPSTFLIEIGCNLVIFGLIYFFLFKTIPWNLVLSKTLVSGGDTGSHNYVAWYATQIFPKLKWWSPDWYAGFPFLYFYPPFLYYLVALFSKIIPWFVGLKIATLVGTIFLPLAVFLCLKILSFKFPIPVLGSLMALLYLFVTDFSIYGGNIPSTLAGEFSYSLGFGLFFIFIALLIKSLSKEKLSIIASLLLTLMAFVHPFSVIVAVLILLLLFFEYILSVIFKKKSDIKFFKLFKIYGLAFILSAFWSLPFLVLLPYTAKMSWTKVIKLKEVFPSLTYGFENFAFFVIIWFILYWIVSYKELFPEKKFRNFAIFLYALLASLIPYIVLNNSSIWNTRFLPFFILSLLIISAIGIGSVYKIIEERFLKLFKRKKDVLIKIVLVCLLVCGSYWLIFYYIEKNKNYIPFWLKWNYEGFEMKSEWSKIKELTDYLRDLPYGRIMWEYRGEYDKFGTPRIFENIPIWTGKPTFEGLLIESGISSYFHFINQAETTKTPTAAVAGFQYPPFNFENGVRHLQLFGANYFIAYTQEIKDLANKYLKKLKDVNDFSVYQIKNSSIVEPIKEIELRKKNKNWLDESIEWYKKMDFSKFIVFYKNKKEKNLIESYLFKGKDFQVNAGFIEVEEIKNDKLVFKTNNLFKPHLIKISYFPGWQVKGAIGPFLISPSFMMVIPYSPEVSLSYHYNVWDKIGLFLSLSGSVFVLIYLLFPKFINSLKEKKLFRFLLDF